MNNYQLSIDNEQLPGGYKLTEIGVIPDNWMVRKLGEQANFRTGPFGSMLHKSDYTNDGVPVINPMHIVDAQIIPTQTMTITESAAKKLADFRLRAQDIIIGRRGDMGRCAVVQEGEAGWLCGTGSLIIRCTENVIPHYLQRVLSSSRVVSAIEDASVGSTMINLNQGVLSKLVIPFPPLPEQRSIATALSDVDALIASLDKLIAKKRAIKTATMQQLLTGKKRLPGFAEGKGYRKTEVGVIPEDWDVGNLQRFWSVTDCKHITAKFVDSGFPVASIKEVQSRFVNLGNAKQTTEDYYYNLIEGGRKPLTGDLILSRNATVGEIAQVADWHPPFAMGQDVCLLRKKSSDFSTSFLQSVISSSIILKQLEDLMVGSTFRRVNVEQIKNLVVPMPQPEEQRSIATVLSDMDAEIAALEARRTKTQAIKQGMMQELLTGRTRLI